MNHSGDRQKSQKIIVYADDGVLARDVIFCSSSDSRRGGQLGRKTLGREEGVLLKMPAGRSGKAGLLTSIHMLGMCFPIAAAWLDEAGEVVHSVLARPWRPYYASPRRAWYVLEVHPCLLERVAAGKALRWERASQEHL
jgi:uncharacterized membrane protein (UPF0127 family)